MGNLNKVFLLGRLTREPEIKAFDGGGKLAKFGLAVNNRKKEGDKWVDAPVFLDVSVFNRGDSGKQADLVEKYVKKGDPIMIEGHLQMDQWTDKSTGDKRSKLSVVSDNLQLVAPPRQEANGQAAQPQKESREAPPKQEYEVPF